MFELDEYAIIPDLLLLRPRCFFPSSGWNCCQYSLHITWKDGQAELVWVAGVNTNMVYVQNPHCPWLE